MEMCRACLSTGTNMIPMDESVIENFNNITNLNIKLPDEMLLYTCEECHNSLIFCKQFRDKCIASDHALNDLFQNHNDNKIQLEINHEADDYYVVIQKEGQEDVQNFESLHYDSDTDENDDTYKPTETIIEPSAKIITDDSNKEESQNPVLNSDILCGLCSAKFSDKGMMVDHLAIHSDDNNCQICLIPSHSKTQLLAHRMLHVPDEQKGCLFCDRMFVSTASLQFHYMTVHKLDHNIFDELKLFYHFNDTVKFVVDENEVASKDEKIVGVEKPLPKNNSHEIIVRKKTIVIVDTNKITLTETELKKLLLEKPKEGFIPYYCGICPQELEDKKQLNKHLKYHEMDSHCSLCDLEFTSYQHMLAHRSAHVPENQNSCLFCSLKVLDESNLEKHYLEMHQLTEEVLPYFCTQCFRSYDTEKQLNYHTKYGHGAIKFICDYCSKGFRSKGALKHHILSHQDRRDYKCHLCDYRAKYYGGIKEHILRRHTESRVYCDVCRRAFPTLETLNRHKPCLVEAETTCPICGISLKMSSSLTRHLRTHTDTYNYKCGLCPSQYKSKTSFDAHMDKHNGIRKFKCNYCPKKFYSQPVLIKHTRIHTGERPYECKLCNKKFTGNYNLKVHMRVHGLDLINKKK